MVFTDFVYDIIYSDQIGSPAARKLILDAGYLVGFCKNHLAGAGFSAADASAGVFFLLERDTADSHRQILFYFQFAGLLSAPGGHGKTTMNFRFLHFLGCEIFVKGIPCPL